MLAALTLFIDRPILSTLQWGIVLISSTVSTESSLIKTWAAYQAPISFPTTDHDRTPCRQMIHGRSMRAGDDVMQTESTVEPVPRMPYHEFYLDDFEPRPHYRPLWEHIRHMGQHALATK